eukprot:gnl/TRDRNA2_/TRDRNA2_165477_c3_seq2.p1 gnl/TRDRNA2_/TRDRNA2_165477_c3~~gnl/TRDRNA2_/TRDRNA2_165477_c3_seq2.p1  ORF type:complete len:386 (+),score=61.25 gnl/TRDRNA2_/TRDRNA2_165477_c3_seq2:999-2156(+)
MRSLAMDPDGTCKTFVQVVHDWAAIRVRELEQHVHVLSETEGKSSAVVTEDEKMQTVAGAGSTVKPWMLRLWTRVFIRGGSFLETRCPSAVPLALAMKLLESYDVLPWETEYLETRVEEALQRYESERSEPVAVGRPSDHTRQLVVQLVTLAQHAAAASHPRRPPVATAVEAAASRASGASQPIPEGTVDLARSGRRVFSREGQDGVLNALFEVVGVKTAYFVQVGADFGGWESPGRLLHGSGWRGLLMDPMHEMLEVNLVRETVTPANINHLLTKHGVPEELDILMLSIEPPSGLALWESLDGRICRPRVVLVEHTEPAEAMDLAHAKGYGMVLVAYGEQYFVRRDIIASAEHHGHQFLAVDDLPALLRAAPSSVDSKRRRNEG